MTTEDVHGSMNIFLHISVKNKRLRSRHLYFRKYAASKHPTESDMEHEVRVCEHAKE